MWIERIGLEHHRDAPLRRRYVIYDLAIDLQCTASDAFKSGDHAQQSRFTATRRPDKHDQFTAIDI